MGQSTSDVLGETNEQVARHRASDRHIYRLKVRARVPVRFPITFSALQYPNAVIHPIRELSNGQEAIVNPIRRVFDEVSTPLLRPRGVNVILVISHMGVRNTVIRREYQVEDVTDLRGQVLHLRRSNGRRKRTARRAFPSAKWVAFGFRVRNVGFAELFLHSILRYSAETGMEAFTLCQDMAVLRDPFSVLRAYPV